MGKRLYLDTSAALRPVLERGLSPQTERDLGEAELLVTSRLSLVESARVFHRLRHQNALPPAALATAERELDALWARCEIWELTIGICEDAGRLLPGRTLRSLDALHLATFLAAGRRLDGLELLTADARLREAAFSRP